MFAGETINSPRFWENRGQKAEQINLPRTHSSEQKFEPQMPLCSHSRDWSRFFFLKLCFSLSYREWIINDNRALCISEVLGLQRSISVGGWGAGVPSSRKLLMQLPLPKDKEGPHRGLREEEQWFRMKTESPGGQTEICTNSSPFWIGGFASVLKEQNWIWKLKGWGKWVCPQFGTDSIFPNILFENAPS